MEEVEEAEELVRRILGLAQTETDDRRNTFRGGGETLASFLFSQT